MATRLPLACAAVRASVVETSPRVSLYLGDLARRRPANGSATPAALGDLRS